MAGLPEQRKAHTRAQIELHGLRLIGQQGYARTSCEQIAAAAGVSAATLFRYFPTKEDIVLHDVYDPMIAEAVRARPTAEPWLTAVRRGLADAFADVYEADLEDIRARNRADPVGAGPTRPDGGAAGEHHHVPGPGAGRPSRGHRRPKTADSGGGRCLRRSLEHRRGALGGGGRTPARPRRRGVGLAGRPGGRF